MVAAGFIRGHLVKELLNQVREVVFDDTKPQEF